MKYLVQKYPGLTRLQPKDVFTSYLDNIRLYIGASSIVAYNSQHSSTLGKIAVCGKTKPAPTICTKEISELKQQLLMSMSLGLANIIKYDERTVFIEISRPAPTDEYSNHGNQQNKHAHENEHFVPRKSSVNTSNRREHNWFKCLFEENIPLWMNFSVDPESHSKPVKKLDHLQRLLESASSVLDLVFDHISLSSDPLTLLCSRSILQSKITQLGASEDIGLIMLHCIDFNQINKKFGHEYGDKVIREIATNLSPITRESDILSRFSGALFGIAFAASEQDDVTAFAKKLQNALQHCQYLDGAINLSFNIGAAIILQSETFKSDTERTATLVNRADQALTAAQQERIPSIITWTNDDFSLHQQQFNYLGGIFTADTVTDYRNMLLLWDISSLIADKFEFSHLLQSVVQRLAQTFEFLCAGIISDKTDVDEALLYSIDSDDRATALIPRDKNLLPTLHQMQTVVKENNKPSERYIEGNLILLLPLKIDSSDCFFISGSEDKFQITHDTKVLLSGLIRQLGKALRRSRLEEALNRKLETQNEELQNELATLKEGIQVSSIIYQSEIMHNLMKHAKRAAATDTTVLVTGESGTGKERLLNAIHTLGPRSNHPLVIVDCGSIPETLIESELFGYVKGAFTGAQNSSNGKISDANGGVLVLDEIGELPLQMQTKLLRFVQEKHFTPVGGNKLKDVDVKIVAVTNRNLAEEVEKGTFRRDLYYRLNVLTLHNPPLRERTEDIPLLSKHFLNKFAEQFGTSKKSLSPLAIERMNRYSWPGNIRELENRLMQATLICDGDFIEWESLNIAEENTQSALLIQDIQSTEPPSLPTNIIPTSVDKLPNEIAPRTSSQPIDKESVICELSRALVDSFKSYHQHPHFFNAPVGTWIEDDLILSTYVESGEKMRTTAARLHISQSKARRRVDSILNTQSETPKYRPPNWSMIEEALLPIANGSIVIHDCLSEIKLITLKAILEKATFNMAQAAEMMGVSEPTFYKLKKSLESKTTDPV